MALFLLSLAGPILDSDALRVARHWAQSAFVCRTSGQGPAQIFLLNFVYSAGIISVFLALAAFTIVFQKGLGQQMQSAGFNITMMAIVFAMALSFLGVWEIPIPGFATTPGISRSTQRVGYEGAFSKGS